MDRERASQPVLFPNVDGDSIGSSYKKNNTFFCVYYGNMHYYKFIYNKICNF